jgi:hypothetical protein
MFTYFYHEHIRKLVITFGTIFNNIMIVKRDQKGKIISSTKVPLSYGPKQKFLARIREEPDLKDSRVAIQLPRMSFEITSLSYDASTKLNKTLKREISSTGDDVGRIQYPVTYIANIQLGIVVKYAEDGFQILEQIIPYFQPDYTVTIKEIGSCIKTDVPFVLSSISSEDNYEGDFQSRRSIIHTLDFETRLRFYGPITTSPIIKSVSTTISDIQMGSEGIPFSSRTFTIIPKDASINDEYEIETTFDLRIPPRFILALEMDSEELLEDFIIGEEIISNISGTKAKILSISSNENSITLTDPDGFFEIDEFITGLQSSQTGKIVEIKQDWNTLK